MSYARGTCVSVDDRWISFGFSPKRVRITVFNRKLSCMIGGG